MCGGYAVSAQDATQYPRKPHQPHHLDNVLTAKRRDLRTSKRNLSMKTKGICLENKAYIGGKRGHGSVGS